MGPPSALTRLLSSARPGAFRLFLAFAVLVSHSSRFNLGSWAVYTFFVLSGYWIHRMWSDKYAGAAHPVRLFYGSRLLRILPLFWLVNLGACALLAAGLQPAYAGPPVASWGGLRSAAVNVLLLGYAELPLPQRALGVAWSLDVELQFYLAFPLLLYLCTRGRLGKYVLATIIVLGAAGLAAFLIPSDEGPTYLASFGLFFLAGAAAAHRDWTPGPRLAALSALVTAAIVAACWCSPMGRLLFENGKHGAVEAYLHYQRSAQVALAVVTIPFALRTVRIPSGPRDRQLGELSFTLYLAHWPIMMVHTRYFEQLPPLQRIPSLAVAWAAVALLSWLLLRYFDQPLERWRRRWVAARLPAA